MRVDPPSPCVFVVGCPRSGTTLLQRMLDAHPDLTVANDTHFIIDLFDPPGQANPALTLTPDIVERVRQYRRISRLGLEETEIVAAARDCSTFVEFVSALYEFRAKKHGKTLSGEKTPNYVRFIPLLHRWFPRARFIHIVRDGRDVALSMQYWVDRNLGRGKIRGPAKWSHWQQDPVATMALYWSWQAGSGLRDGQMLDPAQYLQLRYERLVAEPESQLNSVARFLEIPESPLMARFHEGRIRPRKSRSAKRAWLPATSGLRDWSRDMEKDDIAVFEQISGDLLTAFGYALSGQQGGAEVSARVESAKIWKERSDFNFMH